MAAPAQAAPVAGDPTITLPINDSAAGGTYDQNFTRAYAGETPDGTPVYIYIPEGTPLDGSAPAGVASLDPAFDHNTADEFVPCADATAEQFTLTQEQIDHLGNTLSSQIVAVDEEHYGPMGAADPSNPASDALVMVVYNVQDEAYYDCSVTSYTAGYFAPDFIDSNGMNVIVVDALDWANRTGDADSPWQDDDPSNDRPELYEGTIAHELQHLLHSYSDPGELSWVDEGLADFAIFLNDFEVGGSHLTYHEVFYAETSLTRWGGGLENYGASYTFFQYLWERAGGNGDGTFTPDLEYDGAGGDLLIKRIFQNQADGIDGVQAAIDQFNAETGGDLPDVATLYQDWAVASYLDDEDSDIFDIKAVDFGDPQYTTWTMDLADSSYYGGRGQNQGAQPGAKWDKRKNGQAPTALPYGMQIERFRNPGPKVSVNLDGDDTTVVAPHTGDTHWYGGYESQSESILDVPTDGSVSSLDFWSWYFIEEGWDYAFVEALVNGEWVTVPVVDDAGATITSNEDPHGGNTEGNGITGTSGGAYFVDDPEYVHLTAQLPAGTTDVRFRYSTDAAYLDTGFFVDDVMVDGAEVTPTPAEDSNWVQTTGEQDNNWSLQVVATCDLTPGVTSAGEITDGAGNFVYRFTGDAISTPTLNTKCANGKQNDFATITSNLPTGDLTFLDAGYVLTTRK